MKKILSKNLKKDFKMVMTKNNCSTRLCKATRLFIVIISAANVILLIMGNVASSQAKELAVVSQTVSQQPPPNNEGSGNEELEKSKLQLEVRKLEIELRKLEIENANSQRNTSNFLYTNGSVIIAIFLAFGSLIRYMDERKKATLQQEEVRFQEIVKSLGGESEQERIGAAVLLLGFLHPQYKRFHIQVFNLASGNLKRHSPNDESAEMIRSIIAQPLGIALQESYPLIRDALKKGKEFQKDLKGDTDYLSDFLKRDLNAAGIQLDGFNLISADLEYAYLQGASFVEANFNSRFA